LRWPDFFIVGAFKAGTTTLYEHLNQTQGISMSDVKDPNFFCSETVSENYQYVPIRNEQKYLELFNHASENDFVGEASALYLQDPKSAELIHKKNPNAKIVISLRDPVERAYSHYLMFYYNGFEKNTFRKALEENLKGNFISGGDYFGGGMYFYQVQKYLEIFDHDNVKILIFEEFIKDPKKDSNKILKFLKVKSFVPDSVKEVYNPFNVPRTSFIQSIMKNKLIINLARKILPQKIRAFIQYTILTKEIPKPKMLDDDRIFLQKIYREEVAKLEKLLEKKLPWKNFKEQN